METKELKIPIPEGQEIDWQESAKQEKIIFKKKYSKPRSWKEYCEQQSETRCYVLGFDVIGGYHDRSKPYQGGHCTVPTKELAEAFVAMMQLMSLRQAWIGGVESCHYGYAIMLDVCKNTVVSNGTIHRSLTFPTQEMAEDFMNCFKDLLEIAKPLV